MGLKNFGFIDNSFVVAMRKQFMAESYQGNEELFDPVDIEKIEKDDWFVKRFLIAAYKDQDDAVRRMTEAMKWRKEQRLRQLTDADFPREFFETGSLFQYERDREGLPSLFMRLKFVRKIPELLDYMKQFCMYQCFQIDEATNGAGWVLVLDFTGCSYSQYQNIDLLHYFITTMHTNFPAGIDYVLAVDIPWVLSSFWGLVKMWIPEKRREMIRFCSKDDLCEFFDLENLPPIMGGTCKRKYKLYPEKTVSAWEFAKVMGLDRDRCDEVYLVFEPLLQECAQEEE
jgi:hypothetical protein